MPRQALGAAVGLSMQLVKSGAVRRPLRHRSAPARNRPVAPAGYLKGRLAPPREDPSNVVPLARKRTPMQSDAACGSCSTDAGLTPPSPAKKKPRTEAN